MRAIADADLMAKVVTGDTAAFGEFYDRYGDRAYSMAVLICRDDQNAGDVVCQAFQSIWQNRASLQPQRVSIAALLLDSVRSRALAHTRSSVTLTGETHEPLSAPASARGAVRDYESDPFRDMLVLLPDPQQEVITLARYGQLSETDIAAQLGLPLDTVRDRIRLGMHQLRSSLEQAAA